MPNNFLQLHKVNVVLIVKPISCLNLKNEYNTEIFNPICLNVNNLIDEWIFLLQFVGVTFWSLMAIDRRLVLPESLDPYFPGWLNHMMHTNIMIFQLLELMSSSRKYPRRHYGCMTLFLFETAYLIWLLCLFNNES